MQKSLVRILAVVAVLVVSTSIAKASETELTLVSGATTYDSTPSPSTALTYSKTNFNGWSVVATTGASNTPSSLPYGITLSTLKVTCDVASCEADPLIITFSGTGFTQVSPSFNASYELFSSSGTPSTTLTGWYDGSDMLLAETSAIGSPLTFSGPIVGGAKATSGGGPAGPAPYSLTVEDTFSAGASGATFLITDGTIAATPEPRTMLLFGSGLLVLGGILRRRLRA